MKVIFSEGVCYTVRHLTDTCFSSVLRLYHCRMKAEFLQDQQNEQNINFIAIVFVRPYSHRLCRADTYSGSSQFAHPCPATDSWPTGTAQGSALARTRTPGTCSANPTVLLSMKEVRGKATFFFFSFLLFSYFYTDLMKLVGTYLPLRSFIVKCGQN